VHVIDGKVIELDLDGKKKDDSSLRLLKLPLQGPW
jgi:hypothetical protein